MNATNRGRWVAQDGREWSDLMLHLQVERGELELLIRTDEAWAVRTTDGQLLHLVLVSYQTADQDRTTE